MKRGGGDIRAFIPSQLKLVLDSATRGCKAELIKIASYRCQQHSCINEAWWTSDLVPRCCLRVSHFKHVLFRVAEACPLCPNMTSSTKPEVDNLFATPPEQDRATSRCNIRRKFDGVLTSGLLCSLTDRHTYTLMTTVNAYNNVVS